MIPYSQWRDRVCALLQNPLQSVMDLLDDSWAHQHLPRFENPPAYLPGTLLAPCRCRLAGSLLRRHGSSGAASSARSLGLREVEDPIRPAEPLTRVGVHHHIRGGIRRRRKEGDTLAVESHGETSFVHEPLHEIGVRRVWGGQGSA